MSGLSLLTLWNAFLEANVRQLDVIIALMCDDEPPQNHQRAQRQMAKFGSAITRRLEAEACDG